jgi:hypothetical protein
MTHSSQDTLDTFVLVRLLDPGKTGITAAKLTTDLVPYFENYPDKNEFTSAIKSALQRLDARGAISTKQGKTPKYLPAESGKNEALGFLGLNQLPPKTTWAKLKNAYLPAKILGVPPTDAAAFKRVSSAGGLAAAIARNEHNLPLPAAPTAKQVEDALCWRELGVETDKPFTLAPVKKLLMNRTLEAGREFELTQARKLIAAKAVRAKRTDPNELRRALVVSSMTRNEGANAPPQPVAPTADLETFAQQVLDIVRNEKEKRYGPDKVFICHVYDTYRGKYAASDIDYDDFKKLLIEANRQRLLDLARADIASSWHPEEVVRSATKHLEQTFHFVALPYKEFE